MVTPEQLKVGQLYTLSESCKEYMNSNVGTCWEDSPWFNMFKTNPNGCILERVESCRLMEERKLYFYQLKFKDAPWAWGYSSDHLDCRFLDNMEQW